MRLTFKTEALPLALVAAAWLLTLYFWPRLPDPMPVHWGPSGQPDGWMALPWGALIGALTVTFLYALLSVLPWIDPRRGHMARFFATYGVLKTALLAFLTLVTYLALSTAGQDVPALRTEVLTVGMGLLLVVLGNYLPKVRSNFFVGVRTPWTLSSEEVWARTHRLAGKLMVALGLGIIAASWLDPTLRFVVVMAGVLGFAAIAVGYSYWLYRRLPGAAGD